LGAIAGWYQDPMDPSRARWWNGSSWTSETRAVPVEFSCELLDEPSCLDDLWPEQGQTEKPKRRLADDRLFSNSIWLERLAIFFVTAVFSLAMSSMLWSTGGGTAANRHPGAAPTRKTQHPVVTDTPDGLATMYVAVLEHKLPEYEICAYITPGIRAACQQALNANVLVPPINVFRFRNLKIQQLVVVGNKALAIISGQVCSDQFRASKSARIQCIPTGLSDILVSTQTFNTWYQRALMPADLLSPDTNLALVETGGRWYIATVI